MVDHESRFERLARQVERIARIVDYDEGERHNARGNNEGMENIFQNENNIPNRKNPHVILRGQNADDFLARLRGGERYQVTRIVEEILNRVGLNVGFMNQLHFVSAFSQVVQMAEVPRGVKNPKITTKFAGEVRESTTEHVARYFVEIGNLANDKNLKMKPNSITWNQLETAFHAQFYRGEMNVAVTDLVALKREDGETIDDYLIRFKNARSRCYVSLLENKIVKIATMGLRFYMRRKLLNMHILDLAHLAKNVRQTELMKKEKEKYRSEQRSKSKPFTRKEKVAYVTMESSKEELNFETEIDLAELKKGPPYVCSLLKKLSNKQLILPEGRTLLSVNDLKGKPYCKFHQATSHSTNSCVRFRDLIQEAIMEGRLKFDDGKKEMKVDVDPFEVDASYVEPCFRVNMVGMSYDFNLALDDFESQVRSVYPSTWDGLLDFLVQQKIKDRDVSLCSWCNAVFDAEAAAIFEKERMKKELAHREEQERQRQPIRRMEGFSSKTPQENVSTPLSHSQAIGVQWIRNCQEFQRRDHLHRRNPQWGHRAPSRNQYS
ncbi:hypothetical protein Ahy_B04g070646 isoform A [Arachis hypogaea]|uniref:Retrotransposon gag domain-containing protein n=1 Tax=Arachis hypogaea TaxID=3818 RepID=A0A444ZI36_ARAHY|nr:hypothetical protein Ahy_B04g070646 isoform A [Arachis hypogaea]